MNIEAIANMTEEELNELLKVIEAKLNGEPSEEEREEAEAVETAEEKPEEKTEETEEEPAEEMTEEEAEEIERALNAIAERRTALKAEADKRTADRAEAMKRGKTIRKFERNENAMNEMEIRSSREYGIAYLKAIKNNDMTEARALLSENVSGGTIPVPTQLETEIKNAWEEHQVMGLLKHSYFPGTVRVGFELSATGATVHTEGAAAPSEEELTIGVVTLTPVSIKKWISVSDEAIEGTTVDTVGYIYKELAQRIVEYAEQTFIGKITSAPTSSTSTACSVVNRSEAAAIDTIVNAVASLSGQARNINILMNRATYATFVSLAMNANYGVDVFDGLKDKIVFTDKLKAYSACSTGDAYVIVGDFNYGGQANFPNGNDVTIKRDDLSLAEKDLVKLVGRMYVGMGVVAENAFCRVVKN